MTSRWILWRWQVLVILLADLTLALALVGDASVLRRVVVVGFLVTCPGLCLIRLVGLKFELLADIAYSVTTSLVIIGIIAGGTLYADAWSPEDVTNSLAALLVMIASVSVVATSRAPGSVHQGSRQ
jgi:uncharacterized membrane protein